MPDMGSHPFTAALFECDAKPTALQMHGTSIHKQNDEETGEGLSLFHQPYKRSQTENIQISNITIIPTQVQTQRIALTMIKMMLLVPYRKEHTISSCTKCSP